MALSGHSQNTASFMGSTVVEDNSRFPMWSQQENACPREVPARASGAVYASPFPYNPLWQVKLVILTDRHHIQNLIGFRSSFKGKEHAALCYFLQTHLFIVGTGFCGIMSLLGYVHANFYICMCEARYFLTLLETSHFPKKIVIRRYTPKWIHCKSNQCSCIPFVLQSKPILAKCKHRIEFYTELLNCNISVVINYWRHLAMIFDKYVSVL